MGLKLTVARGKAERKLYAVEECETVQEEKPSRVCRIKAEPLSDKLFSHFEHD